TVALGREPVGPARVIGDDDQRLHVVTFVRHGRSSVAGARIGTVSVSASWSERERLMFAASSSSCTVRDRPSGRTIVSTPSTIQLPSRPIQRVVPPAGNTPVQSHLPAQSVSPTSRPLKEIFASTTGDDVAGSVTVRCTVRVTMPSQLERGAESHLIAIEP